MLRIRHRKNQVISRFLTKEPSTVKIRCKDGITIDYLARVVLIVVFESDGKVVNHKNGLKVKTNIKSGSTIIVRKISYRINSRGVFILTIRDNNDSLHEIKFIVKRSKFNIRVIENYKNRRVYCYEYERKE